MLDTLKDKVIFGTVCLLIIGGMVAYVFSKSEPPSIDKPINQILAIQTKEKDEAQQKALEFKKQAEEIKIESMAEKARLKAEIAALKARLPKSDPLPAVPSAVEPTQSIAPVPTEALSIALQTIEKQDSLIKVLESDNEKLFKKNVMLTQAFDQSQLALKASERNESVLRIQKDAQIAAIKASRWAGRKEGALTALLLDLGLRIATR